MAYAPRADWYRNEQLPTLPGEYRPTTPDAPAPQDLSPQEQLDQAIEQTVHGAMRH